MKDGDFVLCICCPREFHNFHFRQFDQTLQRQTFDESIHRSITHSHNICNMLLENSVNIYLILIDIKSKRRNLYPLCQ